MYPSVVPLNNLLVVLEEYYPHRLPDKTKLKRLELIDDVYQPMFKAQMSIGTVVRDIEISHMLGCSDVVLAPMVEEFRLLRARLEDVMTGYETRHKERGLKPSQLQELNPFLKELLNQAKPSSVGKLLYKDLEHLSTTQGFDIDIKYWMDVYKA